MKIACIALVLACAFLPLSSYIKVFAHELEQDNGISAVLHIPPDDNPVAAKKTQINIAYGDKNKKFSLKKCSCTISVVRNEHVLSSVPARPALPGSSLDSAVEVVFPSKGQYEIRASGKAIDNSFAEFQVEFPVKITQSSIDTKAKAAFAIMILAAGTILINIVIAYSFISKGNRYK